jgi:hydrogenase maturation factor
VREPTRAICQALGADPLRLIASGALLIACQDPEAMRRGLAERGVAASVVGELTAEVGRRELVWPDGRVERITSVDRDELYRLLARFARARGRRSGVRGR